MPRSDPSLSLVPTPIGNLEDITIRAIQVLKESDLILAEDTRKTRVLLNHYGISIPMKSFHAHNEHQVLDSVIGKLEAGQRISLVSDAGTPGISDPGYLLVRECHRKGISVECLPGATALIPALVNSGLPSDRFVFEGFLPHKKGRKSRLKALSTEKRTIIFYESPHRLLRSLKEISDYFGKERYGSVSRELTKIHEEVVNGKLEELIEYFSKHTLKGEIVVVIAGLPK